MNRAGFRDAGKTLDAFDFNRKLDRRLVFDLAAGHFVTKHEDALFLGPPGTGKSYLAQAICHAAIQQGHKVLYREAHVLLEELAEATIDGTRKQHFNELATVPLLIIDDLGMRKLPATAAEDLLELAMRRSSAPRPSSPRFAPSRTGGSCSGTWPPSRPCSTASCTTPTCSGAACAAGAPGQRCSPRPPRRRSPPVSGPGRWPVLTRPSLAGSHPSAEGRRRG